MGLKVLTLKAYSSMANNEWAIFRTDKVDFEILLEKENKLHFRILRQNEISFEKYVSALNFGVNSIKQPELGKDTVFLFGENKEHTNSVNKFFDNGMDRFNYFHKLVYSLYEFSYGEHECSSILKKYIRNYDIFKNTRCILCRGEIITGEYCDKCNKLFKYDTVIGIEKRIEQLNKLFLVIPRITATVGQNMLNRIGYLTIDELKARCKLDISILNSIIVEKIYLDSIIDNDIKDDVVIPYSDILK